MSAFQKIVNHKPVLVCHASVLAVCYNLCNFFACHHISLLRKDDVYWLRFHDAVCPGPTLLQIIISYALQYNKSRTALISGLFLFCEKRNNKIVKNPGLEPISEASISIQVSLLSNMTIEDIYAAVCADSRHCCTACLRDMPAVYLVISRLKTQLGLQTAAFLRKTRLKCAVSSATPAAEAIPPPLWGGI